MNSINILRREWKNNLSILVNETEENLLICSPYVTYKGTEFLVLNLSPNLRSNGELIFVTDLSPSNIIQGSTDPDALRKLSDSVGRFTIIHLPRLHAKVYVSDFKRAIITSGNLTAGGLMLNYEYGLEIAEYSLVETVRHDIISYAALGATITLDKLITYCEAASKLHDAFDRQQASTNRALQKEFKRILREVEDELIRLRLTEGAVHTVFAKTILYLLKLYGSLSTKQLHIMIESMHPDLCDNTIDRVIDGKRFGKKWKHAIRTAQQHLKEKGLIELNDKLWTLM